MDFVCFSINNWEKRRARKQQFMLHLSLRDDVGKVFYVEPSLSLWRLLLLPFLELKSAENRRRWKRALLSRTEKVDEKLFVFTPVFLIPFSHWVHAIYNINLFFALKVVCRQLKDLGFKEIVLWLYHPFDYKLLDWFGDRRLAWFDWAEEWSRYFLEYSQARREGIRRLEELVISKVDVVSVVSHRMLARAKALNSHTHIVYDGTIPELFSGLDKSMPQDMEGVQHPIIGYGGTFYERIDMDLIKALNAAFPEASLVFVGNIHHDRVNISGLKKLSNIYFLGGKPYQELPRYLVNFDVCILPYIPELTSSQPTKVYDYLATGKPIVSTALPELEDLGSWVRLAKDRDEFVAFVRESIQEKRPDLKEARIQKARNSSWSARAGEIVKIVEEALSRENPPR